MKPLVLKSICFLEITCLIHFLIDIGQKGKKSYVNNSWFSWHFRPFSSDVLWLWSSPWLHEHLSPGPMSVSPMAPWDSPSCCHAQMATADCSSASWPHAPCMAPWLSLGPMSFCFLATRASTSWPYELVIWVLHIAKVGGIPSPSLGNVEKQKSWKWTFSFYQNSFIFRFCFGFKVYSDFPEFSKILCSLVTKGTIVSFRRSWFLWK